MDSSGGMFVELLTSASQYSSRDFQSHALQMLRGVCTFDMATWGVVSFARNARTIYHSINQYDVPAEAIAEYSSIAYTDGVGDRVLSYPGQDVAAFNLPRQLSGPRYADCLAYMRRFEFNNMLYVTRPHARPGALNFVALMRRRETDEFSTAEVDRTSGLLRGVVLASIINDNLSFKAASTIGADSGLVRARASACGVVLSFDPGFVDLMRRQWPTYRGPWLPPELLRGLRDARHGRFLGRHLIASALTVGDTLYIVAGPNTRQVQLTPRQMEVACMVASGCSNKEIACRLASSEKTIANHLSAIYENMGLQQRAAKTVDANRENCKRAALIRWWMEHPGGAESIRGSAAVIPESSLTTAKSVARAEHSSWR